MSNKWTTQIEDMIVAREVISHFAKDGELGIFEFVRDSRSGEVKQVSLSAWVLILIRFFRERYGEKLGDDVMRKVLSKCIINEHVIH